MIVLYDVILLQFDVIRWYRRIKLQRVVRWRDSLMSCIDVIVRWRDWPESSTYWFTNRLIISSHTASAGWLMG